MPTPCVILCADPRPGQATAVAAMLDCATCIQMVVFPLGLQADEAEDSWESFRAFEAAALPHTLS